MHLADFTVSAVIANLLSFFAVGGVAVGGGALEGASSGESVIVRLLLRGNLIW